MRVAIITQPLMENYGGLLQNFALQRAIKRILPDGEVITFDQVDSLAPWYYRAGSCVKRLLGLKRFPDADESVFERFINQYINRTRKAKSLADFRRFDRRYNPDAYIVGSDQVWRPRMVFCLKANFLAFTRSQQKIAYSASFGVDHWEFSDKETALCRRYARQFKSVSVREASGIGLCKKHFGIDAVQVLDPTLLLDAAEYKTLFDVETFKTEPYIFTYILNTSLTKRTIVANLLSSLDCAEVNAAHNAEGSMPRAKLSLEEWLSGIANAQTVICDSFHGVVFSVIFHKDFIVIPNPERGNTRISSILEALGLTDRFVTEIKDSYSLTPVDWNEVERKRSMLCRASYQFLTQALCNR